MSSNSHEIPKAGMSGGFLVSEHFTGRNSGISIPIPPIPTFRADTSLKARYATIEVESRKGAVA